MIRPIYIYVQSRRSRQNIIKVLSSIGLPVLYKKTIMYTSLSGNAVIISNDCTFLGYDIIISPSQYSIATGYAGQEYQVPFIINATYIVDQEKKLSLDEVAAILHILPSSMWRRVRGVMYGILYSFNEFDVCQYVIDEEIREFCTGILEQGPDYLLNISAVSC